MLGMKKYFWFLLILFTPVIAFSQQSKELILDNEVGIGCSTILEDNNGDYILDCGVWNTDWHFNARILKITPDFDTVSKTIFVPGYNVRTSSFVIDENNNYFFIGIYGPDSLGITGDYRKVLFFCLDENLNEVFFKTYDVPKYHHDPIMRLWRSETGEFYAAGWIYSENTNDHKLYFMKFNENGDTVKTALSSFHSLTLFTYNIFENKDGEPGFGIFANGLSYNSFIQLVKVDTNLNYSYIDFNTQGTIFSRWIAAKWINDSVYLFSSTASPTPTTNRELFVSKTNNNNNFFDDPLWVGRPDTNDYAGFYHMDFTNTDEIYLAAHNSQGIYSSYESNYFIAMIDDELNVKGTKRIGMPNNHFMFIALCATSDGGCIFGSAKHDLVNSPEYDIDFHILKLFPDDITTSAAETPLTIDSDYNIFPNPGEDELYIQTSNKGVMVQLFNEKGIEVISEQIDDKYTSLINTSRLVSGIYFYRITDRNGFSERGKWIKK